MKIDYTNWLILEALQKNARTPLTEIARKVGMSSPAVSERILRMEQEGIIEGYKTKINLESIERSMGVFISIKIRFGQTDKFVALIKTMPEIAECHKITGNDCLLVRANIKNTKHLDQLTTKLVQYGELTTSLILSSIIEERMYTGMGTANVENK